MDCVFCKIAKGEIPSEIIYEDDKVIAFKDQDPQAPIHFLVIPKKHIDSNDTLTDEDSFLISHIFTVIRDICRKLKVNQDGYRIVNNVGEDGGQTVKHMHFHVLAKRSLNWPPG
ncbi:MAG: histidine triad nucleotide-binding protein [Tissierellia bacterium]|nr:histidine triad nucleotide-binding protein [Tissierellia bacterium]